MAITTETTDKKLQVLDPDLPFIASKAAVDLDNFIEGKSDDLTSVELLGSLLRNSFTLRPSASTQNSLIDPITMTVFNQAISESSMKSETLLSVLLKAGQSVAEILKEEKITKIDRSFLETLRKFFIALSNAALSYKESTKCIQCDFKW